MVRCRNWCLTVWNIPEEKSEDYEHIRYGICGRVEICPSTGREHWHLYIEYTRSMRRRAVKSMFGGDSVHAEARRGTVDEAIEYATKEGVLWSSGERARTRQGCRTDLQAFVQAVEEGKTWEELVGEHVGVLARHDRFAHRMLDLHLRRRGSEWREIIVDVYWGETGLGKSRRAYDEARASEGGWYNLPIQQNGSCWFDGYMGESLLVVDEFSGGIGFGILLRLLDGHPVGIPRKGSYTHAVWKRIVITSNKDPRSWYPLQDSVSQAALMRRLTNVVHYENPLSAVNL